MFVEGAYFSNQLMYLPFLSLKKHSCFPHVLIIEFGTANLKQESSLKIRRLA